MSTNKISISISLVFIISCTSVQKRFQNAYEAGDLPAMNKALDDGANINIDPMRSRGSAMATAVRTNNLEMAKLLISRNVSTSSRTSALKQAIYDGKFEMVQLLIASGASLENTLYYFAESIKEYDERILDALLAAGAVPYTGEKYGDELVAAIGAKNEAKALRFLAIVPEPNKIKNRAGYLICYAANAGMFETVEALYRKRANLNQWCGSDNLLGLAKRAGKMDLHAKLKAAGAQDAPARPSNVLPSSVSSSSAASPTAGAASGACSVTHVSTNASGGGQCYTVNKVDGRPYAYDHRCSSKTASTEMRAKIAAACASGGKESDFIRQGLRVPNKGEL